jgi:undecaprenyl-diphosphatase
MVELITGFDAAATAAIRDASPVTPFLDSLFLFLSAQGSHLFLWVLLAGLLYVLHLTRSIRFIADVVGSFLLAAVLVQYVLKGQFARARPFAYELANTYGCPLDFSFPSGHAAAAFATATVFAAYDRKRAWVYFAIATLVAYSRIYLYCHFFLDTIVGAVIGTGISLALMKIRISRTHPPGQDATPR